MKHASLLAVVGGILAIVAFCTGSTAPAPPPSEQSQIEQLKEEVASLRGRVESLEKQLKDRSLVVPRGGRESPMIIRPPGRPGPVPKDWRPFEFNGMTYYIVPVDTPKTPTQEPGSSHASPK